MCKRALKRVRLRYLELTGKTMMTRQNILWEDLPAADGDLRARHRIVPQRRYLLARCCPPQRRRLWHFRMRRAKNLRLKYGKSCFVLQVLKISHVLTNDLAYPHFAYSYFATLVLKIANVTKPLHGSKHFQLVLSRYRNFDSIK